MDLRPSLITTDSDGWTWLSADSRGAGLRMAFWSLVISVLLITLAAAATLPPPPLAVPLVAGVLGVTALTMTTLWRRAHCGVAVSSDGVAVRSGFDVAQIAWPSVQAVTAEPTGRRVHIVVRTQDAVHRTAATFTRPVALQWLARCEDHADLRSRYPRRIDGAEGFQTT